MAGSRSNRMEREGGDNRKADTFAGEGSMAHCLKLRRQWVDNGMRGPNPYPACMKRAKNK